MSNIINLVRRKDENDDDTEITPTMFNLLVALLVLFICALLLVAGLLFLRYRRRRANAASELPMYNSGKRVSTSSTSSHHRRNRARPSHSIHIYQDKPDLDDKSSSRPSTPGSPVPEIRITFPEEVDDNGKRQSGRVVVVHVGENGVGMSPVEEKLPAYPREEGMQSVDLDRVGGLVEKERKPLGW